MFHPILVASLENEDTYYIITKPQSHYKSVIFQIIHSGNGWMTGDGLNYLMLVEENGS